MKKLIWPVFEFRPLPNSFRGEVHRFAGGEWIPDDGEYDLAFAAVGWAENTCLYVSLPYQRNIICSWLTGHWTSHVAEHPHDGNPWHYALRDGAHKWGGDWGRDRHPNTLAGDRGMSFVSSKRGCANGRHVEFRADDRHIAAGLLRDRETKEIFSFPDNMQCMYCKREAPVEVPAEQVARKWAESVSVAD